MDDATSAPKRCKICGDPIRRNNTIGICTKRRGECRNAYAREIRNRKIREAAEGVKPEEKRCAVCDVLLSRNNVTGLCNGKASPACREAANKLRQQTRPSRARDGSTREACPVCGEMMRADNRVGVCKRTPACREEALKRRRTGRRKTGPDGRSMPHDRPRKAPAIPAGTVFGRLATLEESPKGAKAKVLCLCECGAECRVLVQNIKRGVSRSCGCLKRENSGRPRGPQGIYLPAGFMSGRLTTLEDATFSYTEVLARCECGTEARKNAQRLKYGHIASCGCLPRLSAQTHGLSGHPLYSIWRGIVGRCTNPNDHAYKSYGAIGRGICEGYRAMPEGLLRYAADMGPRPSLDHSTDRLNNLGGYWCGRCPECLRNGWTLNVAWRTREEQQNNLSVSPKAIAERMARAADAAEQGMLF